MVEGPGVINTVDILKPSLSVGGSRAALDNMERNAQTKLPKFRNDGVNRGGFSPLLELIEIPELKKNKPKKFNLTPL